MSNVTQIAAHLMSLKAPAALAKMQSWLVWRYEPNPNGKKPLKVPYYADGRKRSGVQGSDSDKSRLTTFAAAKEAAAKGGFEGVGIAMLGDHDITALDFDNCFDGSGELPPEIQALAEKTYAEISPSGHGIRVFVKGSYGSQKSPTTQDDYGFETFFDSGYVTFTGNVLTTTLEAGVEDHVARVNAIVEPLVNKRFGGALTRVYDPDDPTAVLEKVAPRTGRTIEEMEAVLEQLDPDCSREEWIRAAMGLHHETEGDDTGFQLWDEWSSRGSKYPGEEALRAQWDSFTRRDGGRRAPVTFATVIRMANQLKPDLDIEPIEEPDEPLALYATPADFDGKYPLTAFRDYAARPAPNWIIKGVLPRAELGVLYGASGSGKSFIALDLALAVAQGKNWRGRKTKQGRVVYIVAEGSGGMASRLKAYADYNFIEDVDNFALLAAAPDFLQKDDMKEVAKALRAVGGADLIVVDTFAQVTPGANENSGEDMSKALGNAKVLNKATGALILFVHHSGKDQSRGARGWSGIRAAADVELEVVRHETGARVLRTSKMKDGVDNIEWAFALEQMTVGVDDDGDAITSCVAVECDPPEEETVETLMKASKKGYGVNQRILLEWVDTLPTDITSMRLKEFEDQIAELLPAPPKGTRDGRRATMNRVLKQLATGPNAKFDIVNGYVHFLA